MKLTYAFCEDWKIFAEDSEGTLYCVSTEFWPEWLDFSNETEREMGAVERYMLPVAREIWDTLQWERAEIPPQENDREIDLQDEITQYASQLAQDLLTVATILAQGGAGAWGQKMAEHAQTVWDIWGPPDDFQPPTGAQIR